ncbi:PQQ-dependent sugar dehydrogenase [Novosphingobium mangrovi (ex Huang et al. 2023)]|uniref:PQQ-dependent sugar dehydrogenase n=1 Tax=Novosphingobium mangrovi (ex Huang et al. 2023) TaxID=2976432 RepID=A0ABT2I9S2_9SPHN|nr:PQQ-dependent sugar dehydrogenase [Novosphingobium mangrovi (ex Huang et al. 2023)]MCT2401308.1 PQQ-dependent sugar dehydrogenase [Novosphingobium mangrovi (ex Huang et al. 2023)]
MRSILIKAALALLTIILIVIGVIAWAQYSNTSDLPSDATAGKDPELVEPDPQTIPSVRLVKPVGWAEGEAPKGADGLAVNRFAEGLDHPRTMLTLPNGDVLVAETNAPAGNKPEGITGMVMRWAMDKVGAGEPSPDKIVLLRDADGDGKAEQKVDFRTADMHSPSGMAYGNGKLYIANHDAILEFPFEPGQTMLEAPAKKLMDLWPGGNHWMRNLLLSEDGKHLYVAVGSATNIADNGMEEEAGRAAIWEIDTDTGKRRQFAAGMRNPNGMDWNPSTGELWATVQERDMLGPDLVPDYFTNVPVGAQYGWPWVYWKTTFDDRVEWPMQTYMIEYTRKPEYAMGAHTAVLGMVFNKGGNRMGKAFDNGAFIARHGSWNRRPPVGYDVVFVPFDANGNPKDVKPQPVLTGFLMDGGKTHGRPTWVAWDKTGALLVSDDTAGIIWRVMKPGADPSPQVKPVETEHLKPLEEIKDPTLPGASEELEAGFRAEKDKLLP